MKNISVVGTVIVVCGLAALFTGCAPSDSVASGPPPATTPAGIPDPVAGSSDADADACAQLTAPISLVQNAQLAPDGAMDKVTARGLYFTAGWEFARIGKSMTDSVLSTPITSLEQASNAMNIDMHATDDPSKWADNLDKLDAAVQEVNAFCRNLDENWGTLGWYGG
ncbi:hypothetical protein [Agromyces larvae]|uniref:DUF4439 domain-containing protein n=1 Tax=Agromyces larvae TaxID=2929802 RepID=A0ABY4BU49_9MICO|nr:hypothetical protein [Agromyces larvae]UOE42727.1 hypothetical protein MTO99_11045 [Agromyces larvae]